MLHATARSREKLLEKIRLKFIVDSSGTCCPDDMIASPVSALRRRLRIAWCCHLALSVILSSAVPARAEGLFQKRSERQVKTVKPPKPKPFQSLFGPKKSEPLRAIPIETRAMPNAEAPLLSGTLTPVPRSRPDQLRIFILGDSQSLLPFGTELQKTLVAAGHEVLFHGVKNGTPYFWQGKWTSPVLTRLYEPASVPEACGRWSEVSMQPRSIADYVASYDPDVFLFQAGTNFEEDLAGDYTAGILGLIDTSLREAGSRGAKVLWIGQPDARDDVKDAAFQERAVTTLRAALATTGASQGYDPFFDSRTVCPIPEGTPGDGEHPTDEVGKAWGLAAGSWVLEQLHRWQCDGTLQRSAQPATTPVTQLLTSKLQTPATTPARSFEAEFELVAKSDPGDIATLPYTDAFSVYRYRLRQPTVHLPQLLDFGLPVDLSKGEPSIYVLHWAVHNDGHGPRATKVTSRQIGETYAMRICPLSEHPLNEPLGTMTQFNDFDDFLAPIFVASNFLEERSF
jgi:hypothetical protein